MLDRRRGLGHRGRRADQADKVVVVLPRLKNFGVQDGSNHKQRHHQRLHAITENEPLPNGCEAREEDLGSIAKPGNPCTAPHVALP